MIPEVILEFAGGYLRPLKLRWLEAGVYVENIASQKTFLAAGYEWIYDIPGKYILEGKPTTLKVYVARIPVTEQPTALLL